MTSHLLCTCLILSAASAASSTGTLRSDRRRAELHTRNNMFSSYCSYYSPVSDRLLEARLSLSGFHSGSQKDTASALPLPLCLARFSVWSTLLASPLLAAMLVSLSVPLSRLALPGTLAVPGPALFLYPGFWLVLPRGGSPTARECGSEHPGLRESAGPATRTAMRSLLRLALHVSFLVSFVSLVLNLSQNAPRRMLTS